MYRVFVLLGAPRIQQVMEAKGYILGTSQVTNRYRTHANHAFLKRLCCLIIFKTSLLESFSLRCIAICCHPYPFLLDIVGICLRLLS